MADLVPLSACGWELIADGILGGDLVGLLLRGSAYSTFDVDCIRLWFEAF